jgi:hypothetical protein
MIFEIRDELNRVVTVDIDADTWMVDGVTSPMTDDQRATALNLMPASSPPPVPVEVRERELLAALRAAVQDGQVQPSEIAPLAAQTLAIFELRSAAGELSVTESILFRTCQALLLLNQQGGVALGSIMATLSAIDDRLNRNGLTP